MREVYKNPMLYYVLIPVLVGMWPVFIWAVYLPQARQNLTREAESCVEGQTRVIDILTIDPERPNMTTKDVVRPEFTYLAAIESVANLCKMTSSNWDLSAGTPIVSMGKKRQDARVKLTNVSVVQGARFLYTIQSMWLPRLTCENLKLQKKKGMPDQWDADFSFLYYY